MTAGGGRVPVVLLHGLTDSSACWPTVRHRYDRDGRVVVALDARGHGGVPLPDEPFTIAALAADAARALRALGTGPALVVGHSMGGVTAEELALTAPELVAALVLEDPAWHDGGVLGAAEDADVVGLGSADADAPGRPAARPATGVGSPAPATGGVSGGGSGGKPAWLGASIAALAGRTVEQIAARGQLENPTWSPEEVRGWAEAKTGIDPRLAEVPHDWVARDWVEALADVHVPVTLLTAEPGRGVVTPRQAAQAAEVLGSAPEGLLTHVAVAGAGHSIRREAPEAYLEALDAAVAAADARAAARG
ncbi:alpha/beta fold hydrolase [Cellulomonas sp. C5510]|uniref:alpha/beta fold hydrolase n=1 Tax=Cellulomonas sp. C5510 TaxID=2871170 RepID=UPI001C98AC2E|nr:alpha/beta hydrolase [Cellulomonas sp. C5510]QZN85129.1 alpha/beta hydrolase [Cellulomonas sp. C5510]